MRYFIKLNFLKLKEFFLRLILKKYLIESIDFFLIETLQGRGFGTKWIRWIQNILNDNKIYINFNGELGPYFHCQRGIRPGNPLSPFLFDLVADILNVLLNNAQDKGYLKGLGAKGTFPGLVNLYFADDSLLFLEAKAAYIESLKWILIAFKDISDLKINFEKCEMIPLNISAEGLQLADILGCKLSSLPIIYLGVLLHFKK
jgi:Reverse transcriptase (RNA-dependent DNA polymerase)